MLEGLVIPRSEISELLRAVHLIPKERMPEDDIEEIEDFLKTTQVFSELSYHDQLKSYLFLREGYLCRGCTVDAAKNIVSQYDSNEALYRGFKKIGDRKIASACLPCSAGKLLQ